MPAEWEPHAATWLAWPANKTTWPGPLLKEVERTYLQMIRALLPGEKVNLLVPVGATRRVAPTYDMQRRLPKNTNFNNLILHPVKTVDTWIRDYGPIFVGGQRGRRPPTPMFTKWIFNAWGGKYKDLARDNGVVDRIKALKNYQRTDPRMVLEGGSIDVNGKGTCLTTEQCLLNPNRNPQLSRKDIEGYLKKYLGVQKTIWLKEGIEGDDTDGHVDDIARFVGPRTVLTAVENDKQDKNHAILKENLEILKRETDQDGKSFKIIELPMPGRVGMGRSGDSSERLPASYANFYIANGTVLVPIYGHKNDKAALKIIQKTFPGRRVIGIKCTALVYGLGSVHCITQQQPAVAVPGSNPVLTGTVPFWPKRDSPFRRAKISNFKQ
ncbi:MAG: agmatine deiminase family protein [Candidatus Omnitrophica bacterium]|nr:agmatine deiminase family protein [Candidatus Omnitrophota bacterium]